MSTCDPHHNEYLAAISGLPEQTPSPSGDQLDDLNPPGWTHRSEHGIHVWVRDRDAARRQACGHAIGDQLSFRLRSWGGTGWQTGRVADVNEARGTLLVETEDDIIEVDAREVGQGGEVLPF